MVVTAVLCFAVPVFAQSADSWVTPPEGSVRMTGGEIEALVVGKSWIYFSGRGGVYFNPDGSAATEWKGKREPGRWFLTDKKSQPS